MIAIAQRNERGEVWGRTGQEEQPGVWSYIRRLCPEKHRRVNQTFGKV